MELAENHMVRCGAAATAELFWGICRVGILKIVFKRDQNPKVSF